MIKKRPYQVLTILADLIILVVSFLIMVWIKPASKSHYLPSHINFILVLTGIWVIVSLIVGKLHRGKIINLKSLFYRTVISNLISISIAVLLMFMFEKTGQSRLIVLGTIAMATFLELVCGILYLAIQKATLQDYQPRSEYETIKKLSEEEMVGEVKTDVVCDEVVRDVDQALIDALIRETGDETATGILNIAQGKLNGSSRFVSTTTAFNIATLPLKEYSYLINLHKINSIKHLDTFLDTVNSKIMTGGYFLYCVETKNLRKKRLLKKYPPVLNYIYYTFDFILKRVFPKLRITRWLYMLITRGNNIVLSRAEALGRICRAGFEIVNESFINNTLYIEGRKTGEPQDVQGKNYGILIALPRIGREGKMLKVYKFRTMHPYSEYIQDYVYSQHDLQKGGKFKNDFRITSWGAFSRKVWLDEFPMLINVVKGDMKIVGVRPLSLQYFNLYNEDLRNRRIKYKPGLVPPFYYDIPGDIFAIQQSELKYLKAYDRHPFITDLRYFFVSIWNILFKQARSK
ncbi:MAG: sugar transferase [Bacteroidales bacterium]|nr:sugar transferase [Bacteroidales bacterium]